MGGNGTYCTFGPRARTVIYEFSDFGVLWQYTAVHVQWYGRGINIIVFLDLRQVFDGCRDWADQVLPGVSDTPAFSAVCVSPRWFITILFLTPLRNI